MMPAATSEQRFLPAVTPGFRLEGRETLGSGLSRMTVAEFDSAIDGLLQLSVVEGAHAARTACKRLRGILRLVRPELGNRRYRRENDALRDTARLLAPLREADVRVVTLRSIRERFARQMRAAALEDVERTLRSERRMALEHAEEVGVIPRVVYELRRTEARFRAWPVDGAESATGRVRPIADEFASVATGLGNTYARGREEMAGAFRQPTAENHHTWRKRVKYLRYQLEVLSPVWPDVVGAHITGLDQLGTLLGDTHDLADLLRTLAANPALCPDPVDRSFLVALAEHRRAELQAAARSLGTRVYAESPGRFVDRLGRYWAAWDRRGPVGPPSDPHWNETYTTVGSRSRTWAGVAIGESSS